MVKNTNSLKLSDCAFGREVPAVTGNKSRICCEDLPKESGSSKCYKRNAAIQQYLLIMFMLLYIGKKVSS